MTNIDMGQPKMDMSQSNKLPDTQKDERTKKNPKNKAQTFKY